MAKQTFNAWLLGILGAFNRAGAAAMAAGPVGVVAVGGEDMWARVVVFCEFALATWVLAGIHGLAVYVSSDPVPFDDDGTTTTTSVETIRRPNPETVVTRKVEQVETVKTDTETPKP